LLKLRGGGCRNRRCDLARIVNGGGKCDRRYREDSCNRRGTRPTPRGWDRGSEVRHLGDCHGHALLDRGLIRPLHAIDAMEPGKPSELEVAPLVKTDLGDAAKDVAN